MGETPATRRALENPEQASENGIDPLGELRHLILAPEQEALNRLHQRVSDPEARTEDVSSVVAEAIQLRRQQGGDEALSHALAPTIETALRESVRKDPGTLADALFPVMGPAIRKSILETLRSFLDSFNEIMDQSVSWQGLKWRFEALRTGRSFTEVALLHSLVFRVEQVFLIHKKTGLPLGHGVAPSVATQDPSLVSGMLSAIQDFVRDSFHTADGQGLGRMNVGDLDVWVEQGPYAIIAAVIRGIAPRALRDSLAETLENIHRQYAPQLEGFDGNTAPFAAVDGDLARCLAFRYKEEPRRKGRGYVWAAAAIVLLVLGGWAGWRWWEYRGWSQLVETLHDQPGLVITSFGRQHGRFVIRGLRDPLAADPGQFVKSAGLSPARGEFHWGAYYALDDAIVQQRATAQLLPPSGVTFVVEDGVLRPQGSASSVWAADLVHRALLVPGIRAVNLSGLRRNEQPAFDKAKSDIQSLVVTFPIASATLSPSQLAALRTIALRLKALFDAAVALQQPAALEVIGHCDSTGAETTNLTLSQRRAERVVWQLGQLGLSGARLQAKGVAASEPVRKEDSEENRQYNRSVTFRVYSPGAN
ncbi:MAG TPA: OmpA family protein [Verrucomicrobiae bacterium]|nr:OmpA family protein [Verrucomicrobiae bacterium]